MKPDEIDVEKLRKTLRLQDRGNLLILADRALDLVPRDKLGELVRDMIRLEAGKPPSRALIDRVQDFYAAALRGEYYQSFDVNYKNSTEQSKGTDAFIADFDRLLGECIRTEERQGFEVLFDLLRRIDQTDDEILFFADEGGSWQVGVNWRTALPAYFRSLAKAPPEEFAREAARSIVDFADRDQAPFIAEARRIASAAQKAALKRVSMRLSHR